MGAKVGGSGVKVVREESIKTWGENVCQRHLGRLRRTVKVYVYFFNNISTSINIFHGSVGKALDSTSVNIFVIC